MRTIGDRLDQRVLGSRRRPPLKESSGRLRTVLTAVAAAILLTQLLFAQVFLMRSSSKPPASSAPSIAVVGDSIAAGSMNRVVWPTLLAQRSGWSVSNSAQPGAGFVADGRGGQAYTFQVDRAQADTSPRHCDRDRMGR